MIITEEKPVFRLASQPKIVAKIEPSEFDGPSVTMDELIDALNKITHGMFILEKRNITWYAAEGLIQRLSEKKWREVLYPMRTVYELQALWILKHHYNVTVEVMKKIKNAGFNEHVSKLVETDN